MSEIRITDVVISHLSGTMLFEQRFENPTKSKMDIHFLAGYFTAMVNSLHILKDQGYFKQIGDNIELWVNGEMCCVALSSLYRIITFVRLPERNDELRKLVLEKVAQIQQLFEEKYGDLLVDWNLDVSVFEDFKDDLKALIDK